MSRPPTPIELVPVAGIGEVARGDDLAALLADHASLRDGDVLVVTSKVVSKAEGRVLAVERSAAIAGETDRVVAVRGQTAIVRTRHGLVMAAAGVDASNTRPGTVVLLPEDADASARALRERLAVLTGVNVAVVVTDTAGRAWRTGQTDLAVGAAGLEPLHDYAGRADSHGNTLAVTAPAVADEIASAADLVKGKLTGCPAAVVRGLGALVLPRGRHGTGARALLRPEGQDMFGYGARDAVLHAALGDPAALRGFGAPCSAAELVGLLRKVIGDGGVTANGELVEARVAASDERALGAAEERVRAVAFACGWTLGGRPAAVTGGMSVSLRFRPAAP